MRTARIWRRARRGRGEGRERWEDWKHWQRWRRAAAAALAAVLATACTTSGVGTESDLLPRPGSRVALAAVEDRSGGELEADAAALLRDALRRALEAEGLAATGAPGEPVFRLDLAIREYRPGNAFARWLAPGLGSTVLAVEGELRDAASGELAARIEHERGVHFGGAYTIGAWRRIFDTVADDLAHELQIRIERGPGFAIPLSPRADQAAAPEPDPDAPRVQLRELRDERASKGAIGTREAAFGVAMGEVYLARAPLPWLREALTADLQAAGLRVVEDRADFTVDVALRELSIRTDTTPLYWDVVGEARIDLQVATPATDTPVRRSYDCREVDRTYVWPSAGLLGRVLDTCWAELLESLRSDPLWRSGGALRRSGRALWRSGGALRRSGGERSRPAAG